VGFDPHGQAQRDCRAAKPPDPGTLDRLDRGDDARRAPREEDAEQEVALTGEPRTARHVVEPEQRRCGQTTPRRRAAQRGPEAGAGGEEKAHVQRAERQVTGPEGDEEQEVHRVHAGEVHVEEVAIGRGALQDPPGDVVHEGGVMDERPASGEPQEPERRQRDQDNSHADDRAEPRYPDTGDGRSRERSTRGAGALRGHRLRTRPMRPGAGGVWLRPPCVSSEAVGRSARL
jgi:hypothetical protein